MKALEGRTYAQIESGKVKWLFTADDLPEWCDVTDAPGHEYHIQVVESAAGVDVGDLYADGVFSKPPPPSKEETDAAFNAALQIKLDAIDRKKVRALTDAVLTGDKSTLMALEAQAETHRAAWKK